MHVLKAGARRSQTREAPPLPDGATYDEALGAWRGTAGLLAYDPDQERVSKKNDVETGEDQKGQ